MRHDFRKAFSLVELLVVIAIVGVLIAMLLPAIQVVREASSRAQCSNHLKQIGIAMWGYQDVYNVMPKASNIHSAQYNSNFLYPLLPFVEGGLPGEGAGPSQVAQHYNYLQSHKHAVPVFLCPSRRGPEVGPKADFGVPQNMYPNCRNPHTGEIWYYISDEDAPPFPGNHTPAPVPYDASSPMMFPVFGGGGSSDFAANSLGRIPDGTSNTLLLAHKGLDPEYYKDNCRVDPTIYVAVSPSFCNAMASKRDASFLNQTVTPTEDDHSTRAIDRYGFAFLRDRKGGYYNEMASNWFRYIGKSPCFNWMTSPHNNMPCLFADGSVHGMALTKNHATPIEVPGFNWTPSKESFMILSLWVIGDGTLYHTDSAPAPAPTPGPGPAPGGERR